MHVAVVLELVMKNQKVSNERVVVIKVNIEAFKKRNVANIKLIFNGAKQYIDVSSPAKGIDSVGMRKLNKAPIVFRLQSGRVQESGPILMASKSMLLNTGSPPLGHHRPTLASTITGGPNSNIKTHHSPLIPVVQPTMDLYITPAQYVAQQTTNVAQQFTQQMHYSLPHPGQGVLGPAPAIYASQPTTLPSAFSTMPLQDPTWHMDTGASSHLNFNASNLSIIFDKRLFPSVHVGDGKSIPVTNTGHSIIPSHHHPLHLHNVLVTPNIIKNLISVRQFTRDNNCTIEFDVFGFSVNDYLTRHICDSLGDLYPVTNPSTSPTAFLSTSAST
ncbi:hypothetical protein Tco_0810078 [Tanacetum coccineum]